MILQVDETGKRLCPADRHERAARSRALDRQRGVLREACVARDIDIVRVAGRQVDLQIEASFSGYGIKVVIPR